MAGAARRTKISAVFKETKSQRRAGRRLAGTRRRSEGVSQVSTKIPKQLGVRTESENATTLNIVTM